MYLPLCTYVFMLSFVQSRRCLCNYGESGFMDDKIWTNDVGGKCSVLDILDGISINRRSPYKILFLGDSVDKYIIEHGCNKSDEKVVNGPNKGAYFHSFKYCKSKMLSLGMRYIPGVHMVGPFYEADRGMDLAKRSSFWRKTTESQYLFKKVFLSDPSMVVIASNYWDIARMNLYESYQDSPTKGLPVHLRQSYSANLTAFLRHVANTFPNATIVYRTHTTPKHLSNGSMTSKSLQGRYIISVQQLNALGKAVAHSHRVPVLDLNYMANFFSSDVYNFDGNHPTRWFLLQALNVLLNMYNNCQDRNI